MSPDDRDGSGEVPQDEREDRPELDIETAFAAIVAGWGDPPSPGRASWPDAENLTPAAAAGEPAPPGAAAEGADPDEPTSVGPSSGPLLPAFQAGSDLEIVVDDEGFVPPEPPPLPRGDLTTVLAWAGAAGGPVFLLLAALFWHELPRLLLMLAVAGFVGGFVTLVVRMPRDRPAGDDDDDGAVV